MTGWKDTRPSSLNPQTRFKSPPDPSILSRLHDAHCHPTDDDDFQPEKLQELKTGKFCVMSSSLTNQEKTKRVYEARPDDVIPCFGLHPWFSHPISFSPADSLPSKESHYTLLFPSVDSPSEPHPSLSLLLPYLPPPVSISTFLSSLSSDLALYPSSFIGELGLDKSFKIPHPPPLLSSHPSPLHKNSDLSTPIEHQVRVVEAQVELAIKMRRNVSQHCVRCTGETVELLKRFKREKEGFESIYVCLHSFGGSAEAAKQIQKKHSNIFFSFSTIISGRSPNFFKLLQAIEPERLLLESDFSDTTQIDLQIWEIFEAICEARSWTPEETVQILERNWRRFTQPAEERPEMGKKKSGKQKKREKRQVDLYVSEDDNEGDEGKIQENGV
ncbi:putative endodeoxyribonuclease [Sporobolomyces salmoneus]|uniref:putative endodeoxyribonuclease n=1 Tax=Sporobolomyces salmoneus TaxID=183962 RepID=UPI00317A9832